MAIPSGERTFIGDGGMETTMIFEQGFELPEFASFTLLEDDRGREALRVYYDSFLELARRHQVGFTLDTPTWRASANWGERLGLSAAEVGDVNRAAVEFCARIADEGEAPETPVALSGAIGPEADAYSPERSLDAEQAERYHSAQIEALAAEGVDMVSGYTFTYTEEAIGMVRAAAAAGLPASLSFTVETDGRLPSEEPLAEAVERLDAETGGAAEYLMINCAHPTHFLPALEAGGGWVERIGGVRANASRRSHEELDEAEELDPGDPVELGGEYRQLQDLLPGLRVLGGCCGTDHRHVARICEACL